MEEIASCTLCPPGDCGHPRQASWFTREHLLRLYCSAPRAFWRHDVDVSLEAAVKMARFAHLSGVKATFYVMARSEFYNPFCGAGEDALREIRGLGHELGLHVDVRVPDLAHLTVARDQAIVETFYGDLFDLELVSFHMPPPGVLWRDFVGFENAYAKRWEGRYVSDARREWSEEKGARVSGSNGGHDMQVALHAEHWFGS